MWLLFWEWEFLPQTMNKKQALSICENVIRICVLLYFNIHTIQTIRTIGTKTCAKFTTYESIQVCNDSLHKQSWQENQYCQSWGN